MLGDIFDLGRNVSEIFPAVKRPIVRSWYQFFSSLDREGHVRFMNYGYATPDGHGDLLALEEQDEFDRYQIQLYHRVASGAPLAGRDVLEVGSGRGGGASFVARYHKPRSYCALDLSSRAIVFCQNNYAVEGLTFVKGDAEALTFPNDSFDAVVNVESSSHYPHFLRFLSEVYRVLRPGGSFLWADNRTAREMVEVRRDFVGAGFLSVEEERITPNVLRALELDEARKLNLLRAHTPRLLHAWLKDFAAMRGSRQYLAFQQGKWEYWRVVLQKPDPPWN